MTGPIVAPEDGEIADPEWAQQVTDAINDYFIPLSAEKQSDTTRTSTTARTADPELTLSLPANSTWDFELVGVISSAGVAAGDYACEFTYPTGAVVAASGVGASITITAGTTAPDVSVPATSRDNTSPTAAFNFGCVGEVGFIILGRIVVGATAGSLTVAWAQNASNGTGTTMQDGSRITARRAA